MNTPQDISSENNSLAQIRNEFKAELNQLKLDQTRFDDKQDEAIRNLKEELKEKINDLDEAKDFVNKIRYIGTGVLSILILLGVIELLVEKVDFFQALIKKYYPPEAILRETKPTDLTVIDSSIKNNELSSWIRDWKEEDHIKAFGENPKFYRAIKDNILEKWYLTIEEPGFKIPLNKDLLLELGAVPKEAIIKPIGRFRSETTAMCKKYVSNGDIAAYIIIDKNVHPKDYPWANCQYPILIGIKKNAYDNSYLIKDINVVEIRRDGQLEDGLKMEIRLTEETSKKLNLTDDQTLFGYTNVTGISSKFQ